MSDQNDSNMELGRTHKQQGQHAITGNHPVLIADAVQVRKFSIPKKQEKRIMFVIASLLVISLILLGGACGPGMCSRRSGVGTLSGQSLVAVKNNASIPCGDGTIGNGMCANSDLCCSRFGYCGSTDVYCADPESICGDGRTGNGSCADATLCCSQYGYCGSTAEYCDDDTFLHCGDGFIGNGNCQNSDLCCSEYGYCGSTDVYCANSNSPCGDGLVGNGICADTTMCCSIHGYCGTSPNYCANIPTTSPVSSSSPSFNETSANANAINL